MNIGTIIKNLFAGMWEDTKAVSPIVATLVLVVVAITGAAAVGTIMGTFSSDVSDQSNTGALTAASSTEILIAGSTTVQPVSELLAEAYMDDHQGVKITVQGGGSGAGVSSVGLDIVDIGAASRPVKSGELDKYPNLKTHKIGGSAVVVIADATFTGLTVTTAELEMLYNNAATDNPTINGTAITADLTVVQRADTSGTEETFAKFATGNSSVDAAVAETTTATIQVSETGNAGVLAKVQSTSNCIGFVDYGFAVENGLANVEILGVNDGTVTTPAVVDGASASDLKGDIKDELKSDDGANYVNGLTRPLNYLTNGEPNSMEQAFITFAMSPGATTYFDQCGYFAVTTFA